MLKPALVCALAVVGAALAGSAEEFQLHLKTIPADEVLKFPGARSSYVMLRAAKPRGLRREPRSASSRTLYSETGYTSSQAPILMRVSESQPGSGYDQLIVDLNRNGDLTDDPVVGLAKMGSERAWTTNARRQVVFGPVELPEEKAIAGGRPVYFVQGYLNQLSSSSSPFSGYVRLRAGWCLAGEAELEGKRFQIGVYDGDCNFRVGDRSEPQIYTSSGRENWYFRMGDSLLVDVDGSGKFESSPLEQENPPFGPILYLGAKPYRVTLAKDCTSMGIEPWPAVELATVSLEPEGDSIRHVSLAWEQGPGKWQLIRPNAEHGKMTIPAGSYRFYGCALAGAVPGGEEFMTTGTERRPTTAASFAAGRPNRLSCGPPLKVEVTTTVRLPTRLDELRAGGTLFPLGSRILVINAQMNGQEGEIYSTFGKGRQFADDPPKPTFTILDSSGKEVGSGKLDYG